MKKRKLSRQQQGRISKIQAQRNKSASQNNEQTTATNLTNQVQLGQLQQGLITAHFGRQVEVASLQDPHLNKRQHCHVLAKVGDLVTGDLVSFRSSTQPDLPGVVEARQTRSSLLARPDIRGKMKSVAANVDQMFIVLAPEPEPQANLIDRYLVAAQHAGIQALLVINKWDLMTPDALSKGLLELEQQQLIHTLYAEYSQLGYPIITCSALDSIPNSNLHTDLQNKISVFVGQSGVGKSSLVNSLLPGVDLRVGSLSALTRTGRHTTTTARLFNLPQGGRLIDSPGIHEFALGHLQPEDVAKGFIEFQPFLGQCRFRDCSHQQDPGCALNLAVAEGKIAAKRLASYQLIVQQLE